MLVEWSSLLTNLPPKKEMNGLIGTVKKLGLWIDFACLASRDEKDD